MNCVSASIASLGVSYPCVATLKINVEVERLERDDILLVADRR